MIAAVEPSAIAEAYHAYQRAAVWISEFNPTFQRAKAKGRDTPEMRSRKAQLSRELRESFRDLRTQLFLAELLPAESWNDQGKILEIARKHCNH